MNPSSTKAADGWRVLIVEDERRLCDMLLSALPDMGFSGVGASTAEDAIRIMESTPCDMIILDLRLPGMSGMALFETIRQRWPETAVLILTGHGDLEAARRAIHLDVVDFLTKPASLGEIEAALERARQRRADAQSHADSPPQEPTSQASAGEAEQRRSLQEVERHHILDALERHRGNRTAAAAELGISVRTLYYRIARYQQSGSLPAGRDDRHRRDPGPTRE